MPGPFNSDKIKGVFSRDTASIKQNDVWSSATFNNFVKSVYNVFYNESAYSRIFNNPDEPRLMIDCSQTEASSGSAVDDGAGNAVKTPNVWFHNNTEKQRIEMSVVDRDFDADTDVSDGEVLQHGYDSSKKLLLFSGRGDWSACVKPYALFQVKTEASETPVLELRSVPSSEADTTNITYDAYCCITYEEGYPVDNHTEMSGSEITPRYTSLAEITFKFDPELSSRVFSRVDGYPVGKKGTPPDQEDITVKLTLSYGPQVTLIDFVNYINSIQCLGSVKKFNAVVVGNYLQGQTLAEALYINSAVPSEVSTKTIRFVPLRPCIAITSNSSDKNFPKLTKPALDSIDAITTYAIMQHSTGDSTVSTAVVFKYPGTYGFIIDNDMISAPTMHDAVNLRLVYIPNKNKKGHYVPQSSITPPSLPDWYDKLPGVITRADTEDFSEEFFFIPFITITDRTIEIGGFSIDIDTILTYGDVTASIEPNSGVSQVPKESKVLYDSYRYKHCGPESEQLLNDAAAVFKSTAEMLKKGEPSSTENIPLGEHANIELTNDSSNVFALERTLQFMVGLNWKNSDIVWIDPLLGIADDCIGCSVSRSRKMYGSVAQAILDDVRFGRGSLITPNTIFIHVTDSGEAVPAYSNDPESPKYQDDSNINLIPHRNMWRKVYSEYLPAGVKHFAFKAKPSSKDAEATIVSDDFPGLDFSAGIQPLFIRLAQDPNLGLEEEKKDNYLRQSDAPFNAQIFPDYVDHLYCVSALTGGYIDLNSEYYPLTGQDFSGVSHVVIDDPEVGLRVPGKVPNMRVRIERVNAIKFTYIPRTHWFVPSDEDPHYEAQTLNYRYGTTINSSVYNSYSTGKSPVNFYLPNEDGVENGWRPATYDTRKRLDWIAYNGEVIIHNSSIKTIDQSIHQFKDNNDGTYMVVGACISFYNINPSNASNVLFHSGIITVQPETSTSNEVTPAVDVTVPSAGKLMLWRSQDLTCDAEVSLLNFCGKGGSQVVTYKPVAWPFTAKNNDNLYVASPLGVAYSYSISRVSDNEAELKGGAENNVLCTLGAGSTYPTADVRGGGIDLTLCFEDRRGYDQETRNRLEFLSFIKTRSEVSDCDIKIRVNDKGNAFPWFPPSSDPDEEGAPYYSEGTWQAFDPEIFLPIAAWKNPSREDQSSWATNFAFIESTHYNASKGFIFKNCSISVDLTQDAVYYEVDSVGRRQNNEPFDTYYAGNRMFFSSRIFRKSAYIFYLAGSAPAQFCDGLWRREPAAKCSTNLNLTITADIVPAPLDPDARTTVARVAWWPDTQNITAFDSGASSHRLFSTWHTAQFIFGVSGGSIAIDNMRVVPVIRQGVVIEKYADALPTIVDGTTQSDKNTAIALFSVVSNCKIDIGLLDTTYPCVDEWYYLNPAWYSPDGDPTYALWLETANGFQFFTQPVITVNNDYIPKFEFNKSNTVNIALWTTRTSLSGIYGLSDSEMNINYDFNTQNYALRAYSTFPYDWVDNLAYDNFHNVEAVDKRYYTAKRPRFWRQLKSDPGVMHEYEHIVDHSRQAACTLSCYPLFYLADVDSCRLNFQLSAVSPKRYRYKYASNNPDNVNYDYGVSLPTNTLKYPFPPSGSDKYRTRLYKALTANSSSLPNVGASSSVSSGSDRSSEGEYLTYAADARRSIRLAVGFAPILDRSNRYVTPSSCNNISGMFTRVNLIAGMYNHVSGWCYELTPVATTSTSGGIYVSVSNVPIRYLAENSISNWELVAFEHPTSETGFIVVVKDDANVLSGLLSLANRQKSFTRKLFTLDNSVPKCYNSTPGYYDAESEIFEVLAYTQNVAVKNNALSFGTPVSSMNADNSLPHTTWGFEDSFDYYVEREASPSTSTMSVNKVYPKMENVTKYGTWTSVGHYSASLAYAVDVYNTADLFTIQIATQNVPYFSTAGTDWIVTTVPTVPKGYPLHTVLSYNGPTTNS